MKNWTQATKDELRRAHSVKLVDPVTGASRRIPSDRAPLTRRDRPADLDTRRPLTLSCDEQDFDQAEAYIREARQEAS